jgi:hypothetical protein
VLLLDTQEPESLALGEGMRANGIDAHYLHRRAPAVWQKPDTALRDGTVPTVVLDEIAEWTNRVFT